MKKIIWIVSICFLIYATGPLNAQWQKTTAPELFVVDIATTNNVVLSCTSESGIYRSVDHGETWQTANNGISEFSVRHIIQGSESEVFYASSDNHIYKSTNNGSDWQQLIWSQGPSLIAFIYLNNNILFASCNMDSPTPGLLKSEDDGLSWQSANNGLSSPTIACLTHDGTYFYAGLLGAGPGTDNGLFRSTNYGDSWELVPGSLETEVNGLIVKEGKLFLLSYGHVYISSNQGLTWDNTTGLPMSIPSTELASMGNYVISNSLIGPYKLHIDSTFWRDASQGMNVMTAIAFASNDYFAFTGANNGIWKRAVEEILSVEDNFASEVKNFVLHSIYPNPADQFTEITIQTSNRSLISFSVFSQQGSEVVKSPDNKWINPGIHKIAIQTQDLATGFYFYQITVNKQVKTGKMLIVH